MKHSKPQYVVSIEAMDSLSLSTLELRRSSAVPHVTRVLIVKVLLEDVGGMTFHWQIETYGRRKAQKSFRVNNLNLQGYEIM